MLIFLLYGTRLRMPILNQLISLILILGIVRLVCKSLSISSLNIECINIALFQRLFELNRTSMRAQTIDSDDRLVCKMYSLVYRVFGSYLSRVCVQIQPRPQYIHTYLHKYKHIVHCAV